MEREDEDSRTTSLHHDLFGVIDIQPRIELSTGVQWERRHDTTLVLKLNVITEFRTCIMMTYQPSINWIGFGYGDMDQNNHKE